MHSVALFRFPRVDIVCQGGVGVCMFFHVFRGGGGFYFSNVLKVGWRVGHEASVTFQYLHICVM